MQNEDRCCCVTGALLRSDAVDMVLKGPPKELMDLVGRRFCRDPHILIGIYQPGFDDFFDRRFIKAAKSSGKMAQADEGVAAHQWPVVCSKLQADLLGVGRVSLAKRYRERHQGDLIIFISPECVLYITLREGIQVLEFFHLRHYLLRQRDSAGAQHGLDLADKLF